jgi:hypothetical protein
MSSWNHSAHAHCPHDLLQGAKKDVHCSLAFSEFKNSSPQQLKRQVKEGMTKAKIKYFPWGKATYEVSHETVVDLETVLISVRM